MPRVALAALAALALAGCGDGGVAGPSTPRAAEQLLTGRDVARYAPDSPARAVLAWWRAAQFASAPEFEAAYADEPRRRIERDPHAREALLHFAGAIRLARPRVLSVSRRGTLATVYTRIEYRQPIGARRYVALSVPRAFVLVDDRGWRLVDDDFVQDALPPALRRSA
jgi:hypothetical protein